MNPEGARPFPSERRVFLAVFLLAALLAAPRPGHNENRTLDLLAALSHGKLSIDEYANTSDRAWVPSAPGSASVAASGVVPGGLGGHYYSGGAPGLAFALLPVYVVARPLVPERLLELVLVLAGAALPLALGTLGVRRALEALGVSPEKATAAALVHALSTLALPFGTRLYAGSLVVALLAWALAFLLSPQAKERDLPTPSPSPTKWGRVGVGAGFLAACAVACDYSVALPVLALVAIAMMRGGVRSLAAFALGSVAPALVVASYHQACFGSPLRTAYDFHSDPHIQGVLAHGAWGFTWPRPRILLEILLGTRRGFLWTQPAALVGLAGLVSLARRDRVSACSLGAALLVLLANASRVKDWDAGASFGARYTLSALPFLALGLPRGLELLGRAARPVILASSILAFVGATSEWGFDVLSSLESIYRLGPHASSLAIVLLDAPYSIEPDSVLPLALLSSAALAAGIVSASLILGNSRRAEVFALAVLPFLACLPVATQVFFHGPAAIQRGWHDLLRREARRQIAAVEDPDEARAVAGVMSWKWRGLEDPELYRDALDRVLELDPGDARSRELREHWKP